MKQWIRDRLDGKPPTPGRKVRATAASIIRPIGAPKTEKSCRQCGEMLPLSEFYQHRNRQAKSGFSHASQCNACRKIQMICRYRGLTREQYDTAVAGSNGNCDICLRPYKKPSIDHCHTSGGVRGVLCVACNNGLGMFRDDVEALTRAIEYLRRHRG